MTAHGGPCYAGSRTSRLRAPGTATILPTVGRGSAGWTASAAGGAWAKVPNVTAVQVVTDNGEGCARTPDGKVACWGCLGASWASQRERPSKPVFVPRLTDVSELARTVTQTCALRTDDSVVCWGIAMTPVTPVSDVPVSVAL